MEGSVSQLDLTTYVGLSAAVVMVIGLLKGLFPTWVEGKEPKMGVAFSYVFGVAAKLTIPGAFEKIQWIAFLISLLGVAAGAKIGHDYILNQVVKGKPDGSPSPTPKLLLCVIAIGLLLGGCCAVEQRTAVDINTAQEMILPEYSAYVQADQKLSDAQKKDRALQVQKLREATVKLLR